ncbi:MAG: hypothetical protein LBQ83_02995 [Candidatus Margulisbacteria bacterium]|nr:hypothetical protein [Candidatus Margulisiibacteriota bacterium]
MLLLGACAAALEIAGTEAAVDVLRGQTARVELTLKNNTPQAENIRVDYLLEKYPDGQPDNYLELLAGLEKAREFTLGPGAEQKYAFPIKTGEHTAAGGYLFWLVFSKVVHTQSNEEGDFIVQDAVYYPLRLNCRIVNNIE